MRIDAVPAEVLVVLRTAPASPQKVIMPAAKRLASGLMRRTVNWQEIHFEDLDDEGQNGRFTDTDFQRWFRNPAKRQQYAFAVIDSKGEYQLFRPTEGEPANRGM